MPAYEVQIEHRATDQVFSYYHEKKLLHFNVTLLARLRDQMPNEFRRITMDLDDQLYHLCMKHRGIEEPKVEGLTPKQLREPGYGCLFSDGHFVTVDGHHRLVRRWRGGVRVMDMWVTNETIWRHCLVEYSPEYEALLAEEIPPQVDNPEPFSTGVTVHGIK